MRGQAQDTVGQLAESAARVHLLARDGLGLPGLEILTLIQPWRLVAAHLLEQPDGDVTVDDMTEQVVKDFARGTGMGPDHPAVAEITWPAWEAVARHLCQWINELEENGLRGLEAAEASWREWAKLRGFQVVPNPAPLVEV